MVYSKNQTNLEFDTLRKQKSNFLKIIHPPKTESDFFTLCTQ